MEKKDYCLSFIETIKEKNKEGLYKFFTKKSVIVFLEDFKEMIVPSFVDYIEENYFSKEIEIKRVLESKVCTKIETRIENENISFLIEVKERRIRRLEIFKE